MIKIGPSGNSASFFAQGHKSTVEAAKWVSEFGLNCFEYSFGRGVNVSLAHAEELGREFARYGVELSAHAPYYINFANPDEEMIKKSFEYVRSSLIVEHAFGGLRTVFHPASCGKDVREVAVSRAKNNISRLLEYISDLDFDYILCPETMGKHSQIGTVEEILDFCTLDNRLYPCFDFGHINSYMHGGIKGYDDYKRIIDLTADVLGDDRAKSFHVHFSKIMYGDKGEIKHLTFADDKYGPEFDGFARLIGDYKLTPYIVCESDGTQAEDALTMLSAVNAKGE